MSIAGFLDRVGHLGGVTLIELNPNVLVRDAITMYTVLGSNKVQSMCPEVVTPGSWGAPASLGTVLTKEQQEQRLKK